MSTWEEFFQAQATPKHSSGAHHRRMRSRYLHDSHRRNQAECVDPGSMAETIAHAPVPNKRTMNPIEHLSKFSDTARSNDDTDSIAVTTSDDQ
jgi:hypothetical protein